MRRFYLMLILYHASKKGSFDRVLNRSFMMDVRELSGDERGLGGVFLFLF